MTILLNILNTQKNFSFYSLYIHLYINVTNKDEKTFAFGGIEKDEILYKQLVNRKEFYITYTLAASSLLT